MEPVDIFVLLVVVFFIGLLLTPTIIEAFRK